MNDVVKTRKDLLDELAAARQRIAGLEVARTERQALALALRESEERFQVALRNSRIVVYNQDRALRYTWIYNPLLGFTPDGILGKTDADLLLPEDAAPLDQIKRQVLETGTGVRETVRTKIDGNTYFYDLTVEPLRDVAGEIIGVTGASRDITEQVHAREALQESEERYRLLAENASDVVWIANLQFETTYVSPSIQRLRGYTADEVMAQPFEEIMTPESLAVVQAAFVQGQPIEQSDEHRSRRARTLELEFLCKDGSTVWTETNLTYVRSPDGEPLAITGVTRDIAERRQAALALGEQSHALGERVKELNCLYAMSRLREKAGVSLDEIYQRTVDLIPPAWQYPEITAARVIIDDREFRTENFQVHAPCRQSADIVVYGQVCGRVQVCYVEDREGCDEGPFLTEERSLLDTIAERLGRITEHMRMEVALQATRDGLEVRVQARTADLRKGHQREQVLNALLRLSMEDISLDEQLERALDELLSIPWLPVQPQGGIFLVRRDTPAESPVLELRAQRGMSPSAQFACRRVSFGQCLCGRAAASGRLLFAEPGDARHEIQHEGPEPYSHYCVPILSSKRSIGTIVLYLKQGHPRDALQEEFLRAVAHTLAGIIERKRVEEALRKSGQQLRAMNEQLEDYGRKLENEVDERTREIERRRQVAESLRDMLAVLNSDRPLAEILSHIVLVARRLLGSETSAIYRLSGPHGAFEAQTVDGQHADLVSPLPFPSGYRQTLQDGKPVAVSDSRLAFLELTSQDAAASILPESLSGHFPSLLAVPLILADEVYGGLVLYYSEPRVFSGEDVDLAVAFADQAALAIENARLHKQAEEAAVLAERERLARDLHDSVTQSLYSITLLAEGWKRLESAGRLEEAEDPLGDLGEIAQQALKEMRLMVHELRPPDLDEVGLVGALHLRLGAVEKRAGVEARLVAGDVLALPPPVEECLYRIAIEALNNALKHAAATEVVVSLQPSGSSVILEVRDNGCGFDASRLDERRGVGLHSMRERAERMGGALAIESEVGVGTKVKAILTQNTISPRRQSNA